MMEEALCFGLACSILAGIAACWLAVVVLCIDLVGRRWLSAGQRALLWGLVLLRLLAPFAPTSVVSLQNLPEWWSRLAPAPAPAQDAAFRVHPQLPDSQPTADVVLNVPPYPDELPFDPFIWFLALSHWIWLAGALWILCTTLVRHWRFSRRIRGMSKCDDERLLGVWSSCLAQAQVRRRIPVVVADIIAQPAVLGWLRPTLLLPPSAASLTDDALRMVMFHELAHIRRWDVAANWMMLFIKALQWWNPLYWLTAARIQALREQACDAFVLRQMPECSAQDYGALLLEFADRSASSGWRVKIAASILGLTGTGRKWLRRLRTVGLRRRLHALRRGGCEYSRGQKCAVAALLLVVAACGLTDATQPEPERYPAWMVNQPTTDIRMLPSVLADGPLVVRTYDVQRALEQFSQEFRADGEAEKMLEWDVADLIKKVAPDRADGKAEGERPWFRREGHQVTVGAPESIQQEFATRLSAWEQSGLTQVVLECRVLKSPTNFLLREGVTSETAEITTSPEVSQESGVVAQIAEPVPVVVATLKPGSTRALIEAAQGDARSNLMWAPKITTFNGQAATITDCVSRPFVTGVHQDPDGGLEPRLSFVDEGMKVSTRVVVGKRLRVTGDVELCELRDVRTWSTSLSGKTATIQTPIVKRCRAHLDTEVDDDDSILIGTLPSREGKAATYVLLTLRRIVMEPEVVR